MPPFIKGAELARAFYDEVIAPILRGEAHSAAFIGDGSDVFGFDSERSTDHGWGPRLQVFVPAGRIDSVSGAVSQALPATFRGWPVRFGWDDVAVDHHVAVVAPGPWLASRLGVDPTNTLTHLDWLSMPHERLAEVTRGPVFRDDSGALTTVRSRLAWYPDQVWLYLLASQWRRISQEEAFVGRAAEAGDELGSRLVAARLVRDLMRLCFLIERRYPPYMKWFGSAFDELSLAAELRPVFERTLSASDYAAREAALVIAYRTIGERQNALGLMPPVDAEPRGYYGRPFVVSAATEFVAACMAAIDDPWLATRAPVGSVDQWVDSTDVLAHPARARAVAAALVADDVDQGWRGH